jgi:hypothetical protein
MTQLCAMDCSTRSSCPGRFYTAKTPTNVDRREKSFRGRESRARSRSLASAFDGGRIGRGNAQMYLCLAAQCVDRIAANQ